MATSRYKIAGIILFGALVTGAVYYATRPIVPISSDPTVSRTLQDSPYFQPDRYPPSGTNGPGNTAPTTNDKNRSQVQDPRVADTLPDGRIFLPEVFELARSLDKPDETVAQHIDVLQSLLEVYRQSNGGNPIGLNREIVRQLTGNNPKRFAVLPIDLTGINPDGELIDQWGTPYFFHSLSREVMEIQSAGPDTKFWTKDDINPAMDLRNASLGKQP